MEQSIMPNDTIIPVLKPSNLTQQDSVADDLPQKNPDFVLIWNSKNDTSVKESSFEQRSVFEYNLEEEGLILEWENSTSSPQLHAIKIWAPLEVLKRYAEILKLRLPMKEFSKEDTEGKESLTSLRKSSEWLHECWGSLGKWCDLDEPMLTKKAKILTGVYSREREYLFDLDDSNVDNAFPVAVRARIVQYILTKTPYKKEEDLKGDAFGFGYERLIQKKVYETAYPLHDGSINTEGSIRKLLNDNWGSFSACCKFQPLDAIKNYFGVNIALYFAWLGFYTRMLLFAAFFGIICFFYGILTVSSDQSLKDICNKNKNFTMCPACDKKCKYWELSDKCQDARISYLFDNEFSFLFALYMSIWVAVFLEMWKRYTARITHHWDLSAFDLKKDFNPRPEYVAELKRIYSEKEGRNENQDGENGGKEETKTKLDDPDLRIPFWSRQLPFGIFSYSMVLLMVIIALAAMIGVILYRLWFSTYMYSTNSLEFGELRLLISGTAAFINLLFILIFGKAYKRIAMLLTKMEYPRTHIEFESSYTLKVYLLEFINNYGSIFYVAFIKGAYAGTPNKYHKILGWRQEECGLGCMSELCIQLGIIMLGKQIKNIFLEAGVPLLRRGCKNVTRKVSHAESRRTLGVPPTQSAKTVIRRQPQWVQDYELLDWDKFTLVDDYLDMVIQLGFITIFVAAFPLAPLFALINNVIELRLDANKMLTHYQRPVGYRAKGIGVWADIVEGVVNIAVISNAMIIALTSSFIPKMMYRFFLLDKDDPNHGTLNGYLEFTLTSFSKDDLESLPTTQSPRDCFFQTFRYGHNAPQDIRYTFRPEFWKIWLARVIFVVLYENFVHLVLIFIRWAIPDVPYSLRTKMEKEERIVNGLILKQEQEAARKMFMPRHRRSKGSAEREGLEAGVHSGRHHHHRNHQGQSATKVANGGEARLASATSKSRQPEN